MINCLKNAYGEFNATSHIGPACFAHFDLIFIHQGTVKIRMLNEHEIHLQSGQALLIYPRTHFVGHTVTPWTQCSVHHFKTDAPDYAQKNAGFEVFTAGPLPSIEQDIQRVAMLASAKQSNLIKKMQGSVMQLILFQLQIEHDTEARLEVRQSEFMPLIQWLGNNLDKPIALDDMARKAKRSPSHFRALFKSQMGIGPGSYFLSLRLNEATRLLRETLLPI